MREKTPLFDEFQCFQIGIKDFQLEEVFYYLSDKLPFSQDLCNFRSRCFSQCFILSTALYCLQPGKVFVLTTIWSNYQQCPLPLRRELQTQQHHESRPSYLITPLPIRKVIQAFSRPLLEKVDFLKLTLGILLGIFIKAMVSKYQRTPISPERHKQEYFKALLLQLLITQPISNSTLTLKQLERKTLHTFFSLLE